MASTLPPAPPTPAPRPDELALAFHQAAAASRRRLACAERETLAAARHALTQGAEGVAKAAALVSAWELPEAPRLPDLPDALWGSYVEWLFASPAALSDADYPALGRHLVRRCEELAGWMDRNLAAPSVRAAVDAYLRALPPPLARFPAEIRLGLQQARARILQRAHGRPAPAPRNPRPRTGRPLRVGLLHARYDHRPETFATLARCAQLDPRRVELQCLALGPVGSVLEERCRELAAAFHVLPEGFAAQFQALIALELDCLVFGDDLAAHGFPLAHLAQLRAAPLQIATGPITTGLGALDLLLSGELDAAARQPRAFSERLALLPGTSLGWDLGPDRPADSAPWTRATLGLSEEETVLVEFAPAHPAAADLARWRSLLAAAPDAAVLLVPAPGLVDCSALRSAVLDAGLTNVIVHEPPPFDHAAFASLLALADVALRLPGPAALLALEAGVPLLAHADAPEAALLRAAGLPDAILADDEVLAEAALRLLRDDVARARLRARVVAAFETLPRFADTYALAADFASLLEAAWDELRASGHGRFRRQREPLRVPTPHSLHPGDLEAEALALLAAGRPERAVPCLLSALQRAGADPALWFELARAYHAAGQTASALESLEASLRLDEGNAAAWRLLCELAVSAGNLDLAREALDLAAALAAEHPELPALRARVA